MFSARRTTTRPSDDVLPRLTKDFCSFFHNPPQIFAHSSTSHNRFLRFLHVLPQPTKSLQFLPQPTTDFCTFFTFFHNPQSFLHFLPQSTTEHFRHILPQPTKIFVLSSTTHNRFLQILPQNTKDFCCLPRLLLHHTNPIQFHFIPFKQKQQNFELGYQICVQSRTKLRIGSSNLCTISNKTLNWVAKSVGNLQTKLRIGFPNLLCNLQTKLRIGLPNISAINLKQKFELGFQIYVQNLKSGLPNLSKANTNPRIKMKRKEKTKTKTKTLIQALNFQNHKHQNHQTQKQNFSFESFTQVSKCKQRNSKKLGTKFAQAKKTTPPSPTHQKKSNSKRIEMKIQSPLFYNTSLQTQARFLPQKNKNLKKTSTKFQWKQNKIQNIGYKMLSR